MILIEDIIHAISILTSVCIITLSYLRIIVVILRIPSGKSRQKAFSTCAAHITIFFLFFGSVTLMYLRFSVAFPPLLDKAIALMFAVLAPLFNPIIYSLRNKDMKDAIKKVLCSWGFTGGPMVKNPPCNARDTDSIPGPGRSHMPWSN